MIKVLVTFDYEVPLGAVESYQKGLFSPADKIIKLGKELNTPFIFFADICSAMQFEKWDNKGYYLPFKKQLKSAIENGHDVQLHIHPHWLTSQYRDGKFIPSKDYSLSNFTNDTSTSISSIIKDSISHLTSICIESNPNYKCVAFRAGGYSIMDNTETIFSTLIDNGIHIDSSILPNYFVKAPSHTVDFKPAINNTWHIDPKKDMYQDAKQGLWEIPITNMPVNLYDIGKRKINKILKRNQISKRSYDNTGHGLLTGHVEKSPAEKFKSFFNPLSLSFDNNHTQVEDLLNIVAHHIKKHPDTSPLYITTISHPKFFGDYNLNLLRDFVLKMKETYNEEVEFISYASLIK